MFLQACLQVRGAIPTQLISLFNFNILAHSWNYLIGRDIYTARNKTRFQQTKKLVSVKSTVAVMIEMNPCMLIDR